MQEQLLFNKKKSQILLEMIFALAIFLLSILILPPLFLESLSSSEVSREFLIANFLASEGLEAIRSIRDNNWDDLIPGNHGLAISEGHFVFQGESEDVSDQLTEGQRQIQIENIDNYRKKIVSKVSWKYKGEDEEITLITRFTNWQKSSQMEIIKPTSYTDFAGQTQNPQLAYDYPDGSTYSKTYYSAIADPSITFHTFETSTKPYTQLVLKVKYHADQAKDDQYAIAYSTTTCTGIFFDLVSPTSTGTEETTISKDLPLNIDLSQLCLKVYTKSLEEPDEKYLYLHDIFIEVYYLE